MILKRVILASSMLLGVVIFNLFCVNIIINIKTEFGEKLDLIEASVTEENSQKTAQECEKFTQFWLEKEEVLCRIVRYEPLEEITVAAARLIPLAEFEEYGELSAEILRCRILMDEIYESERPSLRNIF